MSEWKSCLLGSIAEVQTGPFGSQLKNEQYITGGTPVITVEHINAFRIQNIDYPSVTEADRQRLLKYSLEAGDIVFTRVGSVDLSAYVKPENQGWLFSSRMLRVRVSSLEVDSLFLSYFFRQDKFREYILNIAVGATMPSINTQILKDIPISYPPPPEQKAIASVLSSLDDKIDLLHRQNKTLEAMAETLFRQWFIEEAKEDWEEADLTQLIGLQSGYAFKSKDFQESGNFGVIKIKNISGNIIDIEQTDFVSDEVGLATAQRFNVSSGQVLVAMTGAEIGKLGLVPKTTKKLLLNQRVGLLEPKFIGAQYLAYLHLKSEFGQDYIENSATGSAQPNISGSLIEACPFPKVEDSILQQYGKQVQIYFVKVKENLGQIQTLEQLRDTLLPKIMSGEVRIQYQTEEVA
ncbi:restriction endonuclease subunit S [Acinetobacter towneri]|uniref:restriction endonuclease subunit S n=1 Tax=Acinetobacter towneri TaxID=202956 RepID=UPI001CE21DCC|nr:restriction endonuclease subunit S [Acinetobacter towneri]MCA4799382.1 restriction endonuclease subunit S [Acinetobacter towneri]UNT65935.1 restriction endonuclease subunit S [Acinetobacter towneri]